MRHRHSPRDPRHARRNVGLRVRVTGRDDLGTVLSWPANPDGHTVVVVRFDDDETRYYSARHVRLASA
ncbi:hypothetical protein [Jatrophihabitans fulvus]